MWGKFKHWIEVRIGLEELVSKHLLEYRTPKGATFWSTLGFITLVAFIVQALQASCCFFTTFPTLTIPLKVSKP
jgi:quinol-cytochrome oxidoreductase complex cytochrome b subunit